MATKYLVWKDRNCDGNNPEWLEMQGKEFFDFLNSDAGQGRRFILLDNDVCREADIIFIEATVEQYADWYRERCHHLYLKKDAQRFRNLSLDAFCTDEESGSFQELMADVDSEFESEVIRNSLLRLLPHALSILSDSGREVILLKYFEYPALSDAEIAKRIGVEHMTFSKRKKRALAALKTFFKI